MGHELALQGVRPGAALANRREVGGGTRGEKSATIETLVHLPRTFPRSFRSGGLDFLALNILGVG